MQATQCRVKRVPFLYQFNFIMGKMVVIKYLVLNVSGLDTNTMMYSSLVVIATCLNTGEVSSATNLSPEGASLAGMQVLNTT